MSARMGRPTDSPKIHQTRVRMSDEELHMLEVCCKATGLTKAEVVRIGIKKVYEENVKK